LILLFFSCKKEGGSNCLKTFGKEISQLRELAKFKKVETYNKITLTVIQGNEQKVEVIAGEHIISNIKTIVKDNVLLIEDVNACNFLRGYKHTLKVNITVPRIEKISNFGVGPITMKEGFVQDTIYIHAENSGDIFVKGTFKTIESTSHGNGDIYLQGSCDKLAVYMNGINFLNAFELSVKGYLFIANLSLGNANLNTEGTSLVQYVISNSGNVRYKGNPGTINGRIDETAKGRLIKLD
jgi:hypothetical protein